MGKDSSIEWLGEGGITSSPWEGCTHAHVGCKAPGVVASCYAEVLNRRWRGGENWGKGAPRRVAKGFWTEVPRHARALARQGKRGSLFMSICDPLDAEVWNLDPKDNRDGRADRNTARDMIQIIRESIERCGDCGRSLRAGNESCQGTACTPRLRGGLTPLLLTKRPENAHLVPEDVRRHTWLIYSASDRASLRMGIDALLRAEGFAGLGLSLEPLLGPVDIQLFLHADWCKLQDAGYCDCGGPERRRIDRVGWVIIGGESGAGARPYDLAWPRSIIAQCRTAGVPVFHKQAGANPLFEYGERYFVQDAKGGDPSEWPLDLKVREFPEGLRR
jgi:protein gp37